MNTIRKTLAIVCLLSPLLASAQMARGGTGATPLSPVDAASAEKNRQNIERLEAKAKADGKLTPRERARIQKSENIQSRKIYIEKHDAHHDDDQNPGKHGRRYTRRP